MKLFGTADCPEHGPIFYWPEVEPGTIVLADSCVPLYLGAVLPDPGEIVTCLQCGENLMQVTHDWDAQAA
jgi:hypothetical protein